jgi:hypothetical protein
MRIIALFVAGVVAAVAIGLGASAAADDTPTDCVATGDGLGTVDC